MGATLPIGLRHMGKAALMGQASGTPVRHCAGKRTGTAVSWARPGRGADSRDPRERSLGWGLSHRLGRRGAASLAGGAATMSPDCRSTHLQGTHNRWSAGFNSSLGRAPALPSTPSHLSVPPTILVSVGVGRRLFSAAESLLPGQDGDGGESLETVSALLQGTHVGHTEERSRR